MTIRIACIGSRDLNPYQISACERLGQWIVQCGHIVSTGNAPGADQAFARGANQIRRDLVHLHLPWYKFERQAVHSDNVVTVLEELDPVSLAWYTELAKKHHPRFDFLSQGAKKLMTRNGLIMVPHGFDPVDMCIALPSAKKGGGGTGQGMRIAEDLGIKLVDLRGYLEPDLFTLCEEIAKL